jgi:hypothetical protein
MSKQPQIKFEFPPYILWRLKQSQIQIRIPPTHFMVEKSLAKVSEGFLAGNNKKFEFTIPESFLWQ